MVKRSLVVAVLSLGAVLAVPAVASANHPWEPPGWWTEVIERGEPREDAQADCKVRYYEDPGYRHGWQQICRRTFTKGGSECYGHIQAGDDNGSGGFRFMCYIGNTEVACERWHSDRDNPPYRVGDTGWIDRQSRQPRPDCLAEMDTRPVASDRDGDGAPDGQDRCPDVAGPSNGCPAPASDDPSGAAGHDLVSLCGTARFGWYRSNFGDPDVMKGEDACIHTVSNDVARQLVRDGISKAPEVFGRKLVDWAKGQLVPDAGDVMQIAMPEWERAFRAAGRANVITTIGEASGLAGVAVGYTFAASQVATKDACLMFLTTTSPNLTIDGGDAGTSFAVAGWQMVYNRKEVERPKRDAYLHTAGVRQKDKRRLRLDKYEHRLTSMRCGKGGKVFLTKKHDESKIVSGRVRAAG